MKQTIIKQGQKFNLVMEQNFITGPAGVLVIETKDGNMIFNFTNDYEGERAANEYFSELEKG